MDGDCFMKGFLKILFAFSLAFLFDSRCFPMECSGKTSFYVTRPADEYWNTGMGKVVIEAIEVDDGELFVVGPSLFVWPEVKKRFFIECPDDGPVRYLTLEEYVELVHRLRPDITLPKGWK